MRLTAALALLPLLLAACGADGAPRPPAAATAPAATQGITISGTASFGVAGKL